MSLTGLVTFFLGVFAAANANIGCQLTGGPPKTGKPCLPSTPHGPGGEVVTDSFYFVRQPLTGNGTITARLTSLTGEHADLSLGRAQVGSRYMVPGLAPWAKAGIIIKQGTRQGSAYAAMMVTGSNGVRMQHNYTGGTGTGTAIGRGGRAGGRGPGGGPGSAPFTEAGGQFTLTGSGDIAPVTPGPGGPFPTVTIEQSLLGAFLGLTVIVVVAAMFFSSEYRRGLIRTTLAATPRRGAVLAAKAIVIGAVAFVTGVVAAVVSIAVGVPKGENQGQVMLIAPVLTEVRVIVGTAAMLALAAVFAVALGAILRRSAAAITIAGVIAVMPFLLTALNVVPAGVGDWLLRLTPAAGLAIEQSIPRYAQVTTVTSPVQGYYPLSPYAGFAVLCLWTAAALALALVMLRRDA